MLTNAELMADLALLPRGARVAEQTYHGAVGAEYDALTPEQSASAGLVGYDPAHGPATARDVLRVTVEIPRWRGRPAMLSARPKLMALHRAVDAAVTAAIGEARAEFAFERGEAVLTVWDRQCHPDDIHQLEVVAQRSLDEAFADVPGPVPALRMVRR